MDKSNIVVFRNGGHIAWNEKWFYGQSLISVVNVYKYLGICLSTRLTFSHALKDMAARAKIGVVNILKLLWSLGEKSPSIFFKLFDVQIQPILNYGAEVWGLEADLKVVERIHLFALKRFLNVSSRTPNVMVYGETGRYPLFVNIFVKSVKYWLRILKMPDHRFPYKSYKMLLYLHEQNRKTWASSVCFLLYKYGFNHVWENQGVGDEKTFLKEFKNRLITEYKQEWSDSIATSERYLMYNTFKSSLTMSPFLHDLKHIKARNCLLRIRLGVSQLRPHRLRFARNTEADLACPFCNNEIESEIHFILSCPMYNDLRDKYIPRKYVRCPSLFKLSMLFASENKYLQLRLATFLHKAFDVRDTVLSGQMLYL